MAAATPEEIASWPAPNFQNPENTHNLVIGLTVPTFVLSVIFLGIRFYGKGLLRQILGADDYVMLAAMVFAIPVSIFPLVCLNLGLGLRIWDQKPDWHTPYSKIGYTADILFPMACSLTKISLCMTYLRLFPNRPNKVFCYAMSTFVTLYTIACIFLSLFQCRPINGYWNAEVKQKCIDMKTTLIFIAALNSFSDFLVYLWPAKPLWSLQLPMKQRLGLIFIFSIGLLVCIAGVLRMYYLAIYFRSYDLLWNASIIWTVMVLEMDIGIICGCLSSVKPVMVMAFPKLFNSTFGSRTGASQQTQGRTDQNQNPRGAESFDLQPLSHVISKSREKGGDRTFSVGQASMPDFTAQNLTWASSSNESTRVASNVPANAIGVRQVIIVKEEEPGPATVRSRSSSKLDGNLDADNEKDESQLDYVQI